MSDSYKNKIIFEILDLMELTVEILDFDRIDDVEIIWELLDCMKKAKKLKKGKCDWIKPWRWDSIDRGSFSFLMNELLCDSKSFFQYTRMNWDSFNYILRKIENDITKKDTHMRISISPAEKLAATLRYLATGESYISTNFQTRLSTSFLSTSIPEVCEAIWNHFKDEYLKV